MKPDDVPSANIEGVATGLIMQLEEGEFRDGLINVILTAVNIGDASDGGLLEVSIEINVPFPLMFITDVPALDAAEATTLIKMLEYGIELLDKANAE